jgi:hypothetical protein
MAVNPKAVIDLVKMVSQATTSQKKKIAKELAPYLGGSTGKTVAATGTVVAGVEGAKTIGGAVIGAGVNAAKKAATELQEAMLAVEESVGINVPTSLGELGGQILKLRLSLDDLSKDVGRATGLFTKLGGQLEEVAKRNRDLGVTFERTSRAMMGLDQGFSLLASSTKKQRQETLRFTFALENLGVAAEDSGKGLEVFARGTAMSQEAARKSTERLIQLGRQIAYKGGPAQMMRDIAEIGPMIAKFGTGAEQVMGDLAKEARKTGLEMSQIFDVSDQFDTFEGALETAGKLNAQFGLGLSSTGLLQANDAERRQIIVSSFQEKYGSFEGLGDRRQKQAMAESLGFGNNIQDARKYLSGEALPSGEVGSLMGAAKTQVKVSEMGQAAQEKALTAMGGVDVPGLGRLNEMSDKLVLTFQSLNASTQYFRDKTIVGTGANSLKSLFPGLGKYFDLAKTGTEVGMLNRAAATARGERAGLPVGTPAGQTAAGNMGYGDMAMYGAGATGVAGTGAYGYRRVMNSRAAATAAAEEAAKKVAAAAATPLPRYSMGMGPRHMPSTAPLVDDLIAKGGTSMAGRAGAATLKIAGKVAGPLGYVAEGYAAKQQAEEESTRTGKDLTQSYVKHGVGAAGGMAAFALGAKVGAVAGSPTGPGAILSALAGGIIGAGAYFLSGAEEAVEGGVEFMQGGKAATVKSQKQSADQAIRKQQSSERQTVASAATTPYAGTQPFTLNVNVGDELIHSEQIDPQKLLSPTGHSRLRKMKPLPVRIT